MSNIILEARHITKDFTDPVRMNVLNDISFSVGKGEFVSVVGKSGCGKSTLLYILSTMDTDYNGELWIDNEMVTGRREQELAAIRNEKIGFVFQFHYLLNEFTVLENITLPGRKLNKITTQVLEHRAMKLLRTLGIEHLYNKKANRISGGEKQRVAIARALINEPQIIMGDEPTGNLDKKNSEIVFEIFQQLSQEFNQSLLIVTHDPEFAARTSRVIEMEDGKIIRQ
ncbi:ABC transporter ATP-binding protein [Flavihumibacter sp.]|uniref:ABC transporter ATP-binding protein n=1 Tax=Flavihumibacter sp. TaxID=1913981 RepID=UPI002FC8401C